MSGARVGLEDLALGLDAVFICSFLKKRRGLLFDFRQHCLVDKVTAPKLKCAQSRATSFQVVTYYSQLATGGSTKAFLCRKKPASFLGTYSGH
jgi:hypothetical protein